jgi:hypothetical protein
MPTLETTAWPVHRRHGAQRVPWKEEAPSFFNYFIPILSPGLAGKLPSSSLTLVTFP